MTLHERLEEVIRNLFNDDDIVLANETVPADIPGWDSLAQVNVMFSIEEAFGVEFTDDELSRFSTIGELERSLAGKLAARGSQTELAT